MKALLLILFLLACFALAIGFGSLNPQTVELNYLVAQGEFKLSTLLGIFLAIGFAVGWLFGVLFYIKQRLSNRLLKQKLSQQSKEIDSLRAMPLKEAS